MARPRKLPEPKGAPQIVRDTLPGEDGHGIGPTLNLPELPGYGGQLGEDGKEGHIPGQEDILVRMGGSPNMVREMLTGSEVPTAFLPRTRVSEDEIALDLQILATIDGVEHGIVDMGRLMAWKYNARVGLDGKGRAEAVEMIVAERKRLMRMHDRMRGGNSGGGGGGQGGDFG